MVREIIKDENSLTQKSERVELAEAKEIISDLLDTAKAHIDNCAGLAAPQIGLPIKLFIVDLSLLKDENPAWADFKKVFINPEITFFSEDKETKEEGCLSIPGVSERVPRSLSVTIHYFDENWVEKTETYSGFEARAIQHEYDHLMGHVFVDRISPIRRQMISSKLSSLSKGKVRTHYKVRN